MRTKESIYMYQFVYIGDSPRIAVHKKSQLADIPPINSCKPTKKDEISLPNAKMPPKPQGIPGYKLPPKPSYHISYIKSTFLWGASLKFAFELV